MIAKEIRTIEMLTLREVGVVRGSRERSQKRGRPRGFSRLAAFVLVASLVGCRGTSGRHEFQEPHLGTSVRIVVHAESATEARRAARRAFDRIEAIEQALSDYRPRSEASLLVRTHGTPVPVSEDLFRALSDGLEVARRSGGAFDPTIGPLVQLWRRAKRQRELPRPRRIETARAAVGYEHVRLDPARRTVELARPGMRLDFGGIGKGFAAEAAVEVLIESGHPSCLVDAGGDIAVGARPPGEPGWSIALPILGRDGHAIPGDGVDAIRLRLEHAAVATSGDAFQYLELDGVRYSHVLDPKSGLGIPAPTPDSIRSVTVIAPRGSIADALASTLSALPTEAGLALVESWDGCAARIVEVNGGTTRLHETQGFEPFVDPGEPADRERQEASRPVTSGLDSSVSP